MATATEPLLQPPRLNRRRADRNEGRAARDRLSSMLVVAALLHGLVLLGVTFTSPGSRGGAMRGLEVLLVSEELPEAGDNADAAYIAQRSQEGSGNTQERLPAELPLDEPLPALNPNRPHPTLLEERYLTTAVPAMSSVYIEPTPEPELVLTQQQMEQLLVEAERLRLRGETREELYVSPDTRASRLAPWLDGWRQRVERIGTVPARQRDFSGSLVLEVVIHSDGQLRSSRIERSSGHPELDQAAREILRQASPFDPFPPDLARDFENLRFAYEWRFEGGRSTGSAVTLP